MNKIGIIRVSTKNQKENGNSLLEQTNKLREYDANIQILEFTQSAYNKSIFPQIKPLLKPKMEIVVVYADRLSRNIDDCTDFIKNSLEPINAYIYALSENIKTNTKTGKLEFYKKIMDGQTLSHNLGMRVKDGLKHRKTVPKKYGDSIFETNNIKLIINLYNDSYNKNTNNIYEYLLENNIKRKEDDEDASDWTKNKVKYIIKNYKNKPEYKNNFNLKTLINEINDINDITGMKNNKRTLSPLNTNNHKKIKIDDAEPEEEGSDMDFMDIVDMDDEQNI